MDSKQIGMMEAIDIAMEAELKAKNFYLDAEKKATNERGKNLLKQLAKFEQQHYDKLDELKFSLDSDGKYIKYDGTRFESYKLKGSSEVSGKIEKNKDDMLNILKLAIDAETKAQNHYNSMAEQTSDPNGKEMFLKLADEEMLHRRILSDEFYQLSNQGGIWFWGD